MSAINYQVETKKQKCFSPPGPALNSPESVAAIYKQHSELKSIVPVTGTILLVVLHTQSISPLRTNTHIQVVQSVTNTHYIPLHEKLPHQKNNFDCSTKDQSFKTGLYLVEKKVN